MGDLMAKHMMNERHKEVEADSRKYVGQIAARYKAAYSYCMLKELRKSLSGSSEQSLLLEQRKWLHYNRPLHSGSVYVLHGPDHRKWRRRYCVLQPDYTLEVYDSEEDFEAANRPRYSRKHSSHIVVDNIDVHMNLLVKEYLREFCYVRENVSEVIKKIGGPLDPAKRPTQHVLALYHKYRGCVYLAADSAVEKDQWLKSLQDAQRQLAGIHCENGTQKEAFALAIRQTCDAEEHCNVTVKMSGSHEEITADFITDYLANGCKTMLQTKIKGDAFKKFKMWDKITAFLSISVQEIVQTDYPPLRAKAEAEVEELKQKMLLSLPQINAVFESACSEIIAGLDSNFQDQLETQILPKIPDMITKMGDSMLNPLRETKDVFVSLTESAKRQVTTTSTEFANNIDMFFLSRLDLAPRSPEVMQNTFQSAIGKKSPFAILAETFPKAKYEDQETRFCVLLQKLLDSAICTFEILCGDAVAKSNGHLKAATIAKIEGRVLKKLSHDNVLLTKRFLKEATHEIVFEMLRHVMNHDLRNKLRDYEDFIPAEYSHFMPIAYLYRDAVWDKVEEDLKPSMAAAFKRLTHDQFNMLRYHSSSTINSHSSVASDELPSSTKHESSTSQSSSAQTSPTVKSPPVDVSSQIAEAAASVDADLNHEQKNEAESKAGETGESEEEPCNGFVKDGETGECLEVDENGEVILKVEVTDVQKEVADVQNSGEEIKDASLVTDENPPAGQDDIGTSNVQDEIQMSEEVVGAVDSEGKMADSDSEQPAKDVVQDDKEVLDFSDDIKQKENAVERCSNVEDQSESFNAENSLVEKSVLLADDEDEEKLDSGESIKVEDSDIETSHEVQTVTDSPQVTDPEGGGKFDYIENIKENASSIESPLEVQSVTDAREPEIPDIALEQYDKQEVDPEASPVPIKQESNELKEQTKDEEEEIAKDDSPEEIAIAQEGSPQNLEDENQDALKISDQLSEELEEQSKDQTMEIQNMHAVIDSPEEVQDSHRGVEDRSEGNGDVSSEPRESSQDENDEEQASTNTPQHLDEQGVDEGTVESLKDAGQEEQEVAYSEPEMTSFSKQESPMNDEPKLHPNGDLKQNGHSEPIQAGEGDEETPPVPVRRKKHSSKKSVEQKSSGEGDGDNAQRVQDADLEKYNGVAEQIIQTGEEKLI